MRSRATTASASANLDRDVPSHDGGAEVLSAALTLAKERVARTHTLILKVVGDLDDAQLAAHPSPRAHSAGWTLWHIARCADKFAAEASNEATREIWATEGLARRWGLDETVLGSNGAGTGVSDEIAATLAPPRKDDLIAYAKRSFAAVESLANGLDETALAREFDSFFSDGRATVGQALFTCITHDNRHLGELEYIKGLIGLRGTATR